MNVWKYFSRCLRTGRHITGESSTSKAATPWRFYALDSSAKHKRPNSDESTLPPFVSLSSKLKTSVGDHHVPTPSTPHGARLAYKSSNISANIKSSTKKVNAVQRPIRLKRSMSKVPVPSPTAAVLKPTPTDTQKTSSPRPKLKKKGRHKTDITSDKLSSKATHNTITFYPSSTLAEPHSSSRKQETMELLHRMAGSGSPERNSYLSESQIVVENWKGEDWAEQVDHSDPTTERLLERSSAPHIITGDVLKEGVIKESLNALTDVAPRSQHLPVATLAHGLDRVLFNPGVHWLQDPRSRVYNFTPWLEKIPKVNDFAFERLTGFIKSSRDEDLRALAKQENKQFAGSTSSLSGMLSHIYFLVSEYKDPDFSIMSQHFKNQPSSFTSGQRMPATVLLNYKDGIYAIDSQSAEYDDPDKNVLTWMGTLLENFLTKSPKDFKKFMRMESAPIQKDEKPMMREAFRFSKSDKFVMRSQLDCQDRRLPGTGVFDIKTRACITIRMDILNYEENAGYLIRSQHGILESFEKEYYDLIRSAFLKYSFQARIGNMDGVMVTYHNTERIFGFQYISLDEMDERLFGPAPGIGEKVFQKCVGLLEATIEEATKCFPKQSVICSFETRLPGKTLDVFVEPAEWNDPSEERPIVKLCVTLEHKLDGVPVKASAALRSVDEKWTVDYKIVRPSISLEEIRLDFKFLQRRKMRALVLPSSVSLEEAEEYWTNLCFNKKLSTETEDGKIFRPESFSLATAAIERYRELAREGRLLSERMEQEQAGQPKVVLGEGVYVEEENLFFKEPPMAEVSMPIAASEPPTSEGTPSTIDVQADTSADLLKTSTS